MNVFQIEKKFQFLEAKEKELRYYFDPKSKPIEGQKKHRFIKDLLIDLKRDEQLYGFDPYEPSIKQLFLF